MPSLINKRGKNRWRASITVNGATKQKLMADASRKSQAQAVVWEEETKKELEKLQSQTHTDSCKAIDWATKYLDNAQKRHVKKTYQEKRLAFKRLFEQFNSEMDVKEFQVEAVHAFLSEHFQKRSGYAANKDRKNLMAGWNWGKRFITQFPKNIVNPFQAVDKFPEVRRPRYVPRNEDLLRVLKAAKGQDRIMLLTMIHLGARKGEIFRIKMSDLDFERSQIQIWTRKRKDGNLESDWLPMVPELKQSLWQWQQVRLSQPTIDQEHLFVCLDQTAYCQAYFGKPFTSRQHMMRRLCDKAGVKTFGFHAIRHLCATLLYHKGKNLDFIQRMLRHQNPNTTARYLKKLGLDDTRRQLESVFGMGAEKVLLDQHNPLQVELAEARLCPDDVSGPNDVQKAA
jgi:integrase